MKKVVKAVQDRVANYSMNQMKKYSSAAWALMYAVNDWLER